MLTGLFLGALLERAVLVSLHAIPGPGVGELLSSPIRLTGLDLGADAGEKRSRKRGAKPTLHEYREGYSPPLERAPL